MQNNRGKRIIADEVEAKRIAKGGPSNTFSAQERERARNMLSAIPESTESQGAMKRTTTFLTVDQGNRAPSAYGVQMSPSTGGMASQRSRQEHDHGPTNTQTMHAVHAFTSSEKRQEKLADHVEHTAADTGMDVSQALRMDVMDGLAKVRMKANDNHIETFTGIAPSMANPHMSGGKVKFAQPNSALSDFDAVKKRTHSNQQNPNAKKAPFTQGVTDTPSPQAKQYNQMALKAQQRFAKSVFKGGKE